MELFLMREQMGEQAWDEFLGSRPRCMDCGEPILAAKCLPLEEDGSVGYLCPRCVKDRMVRTEDL